MNILILIIHRFRKCARVRLFVEIWKNWRGLLIQHCDVSAVASGSCSALFLHVANSWRTIWLWPTWATAVLWTIFAWITRFIRFILLKILVKLVLILVQINIITKKEVITDKIIFLKVIHLFLFFNIWLFKTLLHFNLIFIMTSSRFIRSLSF